MTIKWSNFFLSTKNKESYYRYTSLVKSTLLFASAYRTPAKVEHNFSTGHCLYVFNAFHIEKLCLYAKKNHVTLNDLFIALIAQLFGKITQNKRSQIKGKWLKPKRNRIIVGVICNLRPMAKQALWNIFSLFLGFFYLSFKNPEQRHFPSLLSSICKKNSKI